MAVKINPATEGRKYHYSSVDELIKIKIADFPNELSREYWKNAVVTNSGESWHGQGLKTHKQCITAIDKGWQLGINKVLDMTSKIKMPRLESVKRRTVRGREGDHLDIHKVNSGQFDRAWSRRKRLSKASPKRFTLTADVGANCGTHADDLFWRGVATVALTNALVTAGHSVEVVAFTTNSRLIVDNTDKSTQGKYEMFHTISVKNFDTPLNIASLTTAICMAGFYRTMIFKAWLTDPFKCAGGLGQCTNNPLPPEVLNRNGQIVAVPATLRNAQAVEDWLNKIVETI